ncbi:unnamed protein product [Symbiodinium pilosum]|uniref:Uncharacterized protein n=1 Tax=Symbiodinium pilosum TaxID=2952 RepID=A0A812VVT2_SYMPI|nr:unnamed protein product [Symbiodinium pilosum]
MSADVENGWHACSHGSNGVETEAVYSFHKANIHERRRAATFARLVPLLFFLLVTSLVALGFVLSTRLLLSICAILNASLCIGMSCRGILCLLGVRKMALELQNEAAELHEDDVQHLIVIANYKEAEGLSLLGLAAIIYYSVCGGPYGVEDAVSAAGPLLSLTGFLVMPVIWSIPEALVTAELATCFPSNAGFVEWVTAAFGPFWGFVEGFLSWLSAVADASLYPVLFRDYLVTLWPEIGSGVAGQAFIAALTICIAGLNYVGLSIVGWVAFALAGFVLSPFVFITAVGAPQVEPSKLMVSPSVSDVDWSGFLNILFWNLNYWDSASTLAGEVQDAERSYPRALAMAFVAVVLSYFLPLLVGLGIPGPTAHWKDWQSGELARVGGQLGGPFVKSWVIAGAAVSCLAQQLSEMAEASFQLQGMAEDGWLPSFFGHRSRYDTPSVGLFLITVIVLVLSSSSSFTAIVNVLNAVYCIAQVLEFSAFLYLRRRHDDMERPYRVPCSFKVCCLMLALPILFCFVLLILPFFAGDWLQVGSIVGSVVTAVLLHHILELSRRRGWLLFRRQPPRGLEDILADQASHFDPCLGGPEQPGT